MIASLLQSNPSTQFDVFVLVPPNFAFHERMKQLNAPDRCVVHAITVDDDLVDDLMISGWIGRAAYYRLLADSTLPDDIERILYLDSDIIVAGKVDVLWETDLGSNIIGAVADANVELPVKRKLCMDEGDLYFNSGVMLIDLNRWRTFQVGARAVRFARDHVEMLTWHDQCALNYVLYKHVLELDPMWNVQTVEFYREERADVVNRARLIHFTGAWKPWRYQCPHPLAYKYRKILAKSPWRSYVPPDRTLFNVVRRWARRAIGGRAGARSAAQVSPLAKDVGR